MENTLSGQHIKRNFFPKLESKKEKSTIDGDKMFTFFFNISLIKSNLKN